MAKILICGDIHWSTYSSIVRSRGKYFSTRLEYLIKSLSWVEHIAEEAGCVEEVFLGDTFDKPDLTSEELTALSEISWNHKARLRHFIVGNHESGVSSLAYNSTQALDKVGTIEDKPYLYDFDGSTQFLFLPYITEDNRLALSAYLKNRNTNKKLVIFSHNDLKNFQIGAFLSKTGFDIKEIEASCDLYINGHLHNGGWVTDKILNLGVLCGQNFSEDAMKYAHWVAVLDTDSLTLEFFENPYALNFYKLDIEAKKDIAILDKIKNNAVLSIKCPAELKGAVEEKLSTIPDRYVEARLVAVVKPATQQADAVALNTVDHLEQFKRFMINTCGDNKLLLEELQKVCC